MSANATDVPSREVARRVFAREFNDASHTFKESDDERAPLYLLLPTGERANRVFLVGTLTETEDVGEDSEYWRGRIVDPTGTFFVYAGQYQPEAASALRDLEPPAYVAVVGKPRTYETDDGTVNVSVRPESITVVDAATRDRWVVETADRTLDRVSAFDDGNEYARMARERYDDDPDAYRAAALEALEGLEGGDELADADADVPAEP
ncbi:MAG: RPA family protein [Haloferacaceae archaeon]